MATTNTNIAPVKDLAEIRTDMAKLTTCYDPNIVLKRIGEKPSLAVDRDYKS
jgi:hypothetical protein